MVTCFFLVIVFCFLAIVFFFDFLVFGLLLWLSPLFLLLCLERHNELPRGRRDQLNQRQGKCICLQLHNLGKDLSATSFEVTVE